MEAREKPCSLGEGGNLPEWQESLANAQARFRISWELVQCWGRGSLAVLENELCCHRVGVAVAMAVPFPFHGLASVSAQYLWSSCILVSQSGHWNCQSVSVAGDISP